MKIELASIKISKPAHRALKGGFSENELLALHGFGPKAIEVLKNKLTENGLSFKESK